MTVRRTSLPSPPAGADVALGSAGRDLSASVSEALPILWRERIEHTVSRDVAGLAGQLDASVATADLSVAPAKWWTLAGIVQRVATAALGAGLIWLGVLFALSWLRIPDPPLPKLGSIPVPTLLAVGGAAVGLLVAAMSRRVAQIGARRRTELARTSLTKGIARVVDEAVVNPLNTELDTMQTLSNAIRKFQR